MDLGEPVSFDVNKTRRDILKKNVNDALLGSPIFVSDNMILHDLANYTVKNSGISISTNRTVSVNRSFHFIDLRFEHLKINAIGQMYDDYGVE